MKTLYLRQLIFLDRNPQGPWFLVTIPSCDPQEVQRKKSQGDPYFREDGALHHSEPAYYDDPAVAQKAAEKFGYEVVEDYDK